MTLAEPIRVTLEVVKVLDDLKIEYLRRWANVLEVSELLEQALQQAGLG